MRYASRALRYAKWVKGVKFFFAFLCVSEHFQLIETHFFFKNFREHEEQNAREQSKQDASAYMLRQTVTLATAIFLSVCVCLCVCLSVCGEIASNKTFCYVYKILQMRGFD